VGSDSWQINGLKAIKTPSTGKGKVASTEEKTEGGGNCKVQGSKCDPLSIDKLNQLVHWYINERDKVSGAKSNFSIPTSKIRYNHTSLHNAHRFGPTA
jgi:hypothetical protein